jgi:hypothetical protein
MDTIQTPQAREIHLIGSVPLSSAREVFSAVSTILGDRIQKIPDGETGYRKNWINFQYKVLASHPAFEFAGPAIDPAILENENAAADYMFTPMRLRSGALAMDLQFPALGYAHHARASYALFSEMKRAGQIPPHTRFQVSLPTPLAPIAMFVVPQNLFDVYPRYLEALLGELREITSFIPHHELAIQWDVAVEIGLWEGLFPPPPGDWKELLLQQLAHIGNQVPSEVKLGYHLCYGDRGHKHFIEPVDTSKLVEVANGIAAHLHRSMSYLHLPVPRNRDDAAYYAPLKELRTGDHTKLFLGLVHKSDGLAGAKRRIAAAKRYVSDFGIATECGLGRRDPSTILDLLALHAAIL